MKLSQSVLSALAAAVALAHFSDAWTISSSPAAAPATSLGEHRDLAKTWTISGDTALTSLELGAIGRVFVDYDSSLEAGTVAKVVVSGNNSALLDVVDVVNADKDASALKLQLADKDLEEKGYLFTQVFIAGKQSISSVALERSGDVIVGDDVLVQSNSSVSVVLAVAGSGDLYAGSDSTSFDLSSFVVGVAGSGNVELLAKTLKLDSSLAIGVAGSGDAAVVADEITVKDTVAVGVVGSGDVVVQTDKLTAFNLSTTVGGSGDVSYSRGGAVQKQTVIVAGSGDVSAGSIVAVDTNVTIIGSGDVVVQTSGKLQVSAQFSGEVRYYGVTPSSITSKSSFGLKQRKVKQAKKNHYREHQVEPLPPRKPLFTAIKVVASSLLSSQPQIKFLIETDNEDNLRYSNWEYDFDGPTEMFATLTVRDAPGVLVFAFVGLALAAVGVAAKKYKTRMEREKYAPLV